MVSEPEYFYTVELPERHGRILEKLAADTGGLINPEDMAARLLIAALEQAGKDQEAQLADDLKAIREEQARDIAAGRVDHGERRHSNDLDDGIPF